MLPQLWRVDGRFLHNVLPRVRRLHGRCARTALPGRCAGEPLGHAAVIALHILGIVTLCYVGGMVMALPYIDNKGYWTYATSYSLVVLVSVIVMVWGLS